ncbi:hypothetical protein PR048_006640 [Dryococelus australis]|uniref:Integrase catalytic domain-containing protein n=1 Tax=Dryococelus australis TaxID=614101 RepID=A0ABQ9IBH8_9NEOP|nr:hypothetical protein PR048_006640 [Dryococelus australis]
MFTEETEASENAVTATLSQSGRPVAVFSRFLSDNEICHSPAEKEAHVIIEYVRKWKHFILGRNFKLITDQQTVSFMFDTKHSGKIKNEKVMHWHLEMTSSIFNYRNNYLLIVVDEFSRFIFAIPCRDTSPATVIEKLRDIFTVFDTAAYIHTGRRASFTFRVLKEF